MREVVPQFLWIGNARDTRDVAGVWHAGIAAVIDLAMEEPPMQYPRDVVYHGQEELGIQGNFPDKSMFRTVLFQTGL